METKGTCKHGKFDLLTGCSQCIAEREAAMPIIVKVKYYSETSGQLSQREYTYYSSQPLLVGDIVMVPTRDTIAKAQVSTIDVPASEIEQYKDKVKTIPAGSIIPEENDRIPEI